MSTTAIFAELLVAGTGALVWCAVFILAFFEPSARLLAFVKQWDSLFAAIALALAYVVGVVIDRIADSALDPIDQWYRERVLGKDYPVADTRLRIAQSGEHLTEYLGYIRTRMRVARSAAFNAAMLGVAGAFYAGIRLQCGACGAAASVFAGLLISAVGIFAWLRISRTFYKRIKNAREILVPAETAK